MNACSNHRREDASIPNSHEADDQSGINVLDLLRYNYVHGRQEEQAFNTLKFIGMVHLQDHRGAIAVPLSYSVPLQPMAKEGVVIARLAGLADRDL